LSKEFLHETAQARNKVALPRVLANEWGVRLPSERFVLTGVPWGLRGEWVEEEEEVDLGIEMEGVETQNQDQIAEEDGGGTMEDIFGGEEDQDMEKEE